MHLNILIENEMNNRQQVQQEFQDALNKHFIQQESNYKEFIQSQLSNRLLQNEMEKMVEE